MVLHPGQTLVLILLSISAIVKPSTNNYVFFFVFLSKNWNNEQFKQNSTVPLLLFILSNGSVYIMKSKIIIILLKTSHRTLTGTDHGKKINLHNLLQKIKESQVSTRCCKSAKDSNFYPVINLTLLGYYPAKFCSWRSAMPIK